MFNKNNIEKLNNKLINKKKKIQYCVLNYLFIYYNVWGLYLFVLNYYYIFLEEINILIKNACMKLFNSDREDKHNVLTK